MNEMTSCPAPIRTRVTEPPAIDPTMPIRIVMRIPMLLRPGISRRPSPPTTRPINAHVMMMKNMTGLQPSRPWV